MGIRFLDSILVLLAAACFALMAYFGGHALSIEHPGWAWATAAGLLVASLALGFLAVRRIRSYARSRGEELQA